MSLLPGSLLASLVVVAAPACACAAEASPVGETQLAGAGAGGWTRLQSLAARLAGVDEPAPDGGAFSFSRVVAGFDAAPGEGGIDAEGALGFVEPQPFGAIRARIGYAFGRFVAYGAAGAAFASAEFGRAGEEAKAHAGWTLGLGLETALFDGVTARAEYLYVDLDRPAYAGGDVSFAPGGQFRAGLNYRF